MTKTTYRPEHGILAEEWDRRDMQKNARYTVVVATCFLTIMLAMTMSSEMSADEETQAQQAPAASEAGKVAYFPSEYRLDAPDRVPAQIETF